MDAHLIPDRDYSDEAGIVSLSTQDPQNHDLFVEYLEANPGSPLRINIPDRSWYRGRNDFE